MVRLKTRVFDLALEAGYRSDAALARAMSVSPSLLSRVRKGEVPPGGHFIRGALRAFPGKTFDDLFEIEPDSTDPTHHAAENPEISQQLVTKEVT